MSVSERELADVDQSRVVAIDGPGGSGKSTVAREVARRLGWSHLDTGAMYRAVTWAVLRDGADPADATVAAGLAAGIDLEMGARVVVDGVDVTAAIRGPEVTGAVSTVSAHPAVRSEMVRRQREWVSRHPGCVVEGRDIGSVVFPGARLKAYLTASDDVRARRRAAESARGDLAAGSAVGSTAAGSAVGRVAADLARRDRLDSTRAVSPLVVPAGAVVVDTSERTVDEVVQALMEHL